MTRIAKLIDIKDQAATSRQKGQRKVFFGPKRKVSVLFNALICQAASLSIVTFVTMRRIDHKRIWQRFLDSGYL